MSGWSEILDCLDKTDGPAVLVTVGAVKGSTPRETGATMLVTNDNLTGTIGGGRLEHLAIQKAKDILAKSTEGTDLVLQLPLGPELAQCCGGYVDILLSRLSDTDVNIFNRLKENLEKFALISYWTSGCCKRQLVSNTDAPTYLEPRLHDAIERLLSAPGSEIIAGKSETDFTLVQSLNSAEFHVNIFGAGHVGRAIVNALSPLPCSINWIDERTDEFPADIPPNVRKVISTHPVAEFPSLPLGSFNLVMTHSHQLDLEICEAILRQGNEAYLGLIGSETKKTKFEKRLKVRGLSAPAIAHMTCPIGLEYLEGKRPEEIALSVAADILMRHQQRKKKSVPAKSEGAYGS